MATSTVEAFSLSRAAILDGTTSEPVQYGGDLFGVRSSSIELDLDSFNNTGNDRILSKWNWMNEATISITAGFISFATLSLLTGTPVTSSGSGASQKFETELWQETSLNTKPRPMRVTLPSRDSDGEVRELDIILYRVQFGPLTFDGPAYKEGLSANYSGTALFSTKNELGVDLPIASIGRLVSRARA